jgi:soluble lytic murein transglycosylase-like protein
MAEFSIKVPQIKSSFYDNVSAKANKDKVENIIRPKYGDLIDKVADLVGLPPILIESFIFIESGGKEKAQSPYATGLMQLNGATASDTLVFEKGAGRLDKGEIEILKKYLGSRYSNLDKVKSKQRSIGKTFVTNDDLLKPEFNVLVGSILLKQLTDEFTENGKIRFDKVITIYNGGRYSKAAKKVIGFKGSIDEMLSFVPKETSNYIKKLVGTNGVLDVLI